MYSIIWNTQAKVLNPGEFSLQIYIRFNLKYYIEYVLAVGYLSIKCLRGFIFIM